MANRRIFYATQAIGICPMGATNYTAGHGVESVGVNTNFTLDQVLELGQISLYQLVEQVPEIEVTTAKVLDGYPLLYHLATQGSADPSLVGRSAQRSMFAISIYGDTQSSASGVPVAQMTSSGMYWSQSSFEFTTDAPFKENLVLVGNNKLWSTSSFTFQPTFTNLDSPLSLASSGGVQIRQHMVFYPILSGSHPWKSYETQNTLDANGQVVAYLTILPPDIPGISSSGTNFIGSDGNFSAHVLSINCGTNVGREALLELGRKEPYFRFANFPVQVNRSIRIRVQEGTYINLGSKNKLSAVSYTGGDTGGGQVNCTFSYISYNDYTVTHPQDPSNGNYGYPFLN